MTRLLTENTVKPFLGITYISFVKLTALHVLIGIRYVLTLACLGLHEPIAHRRLHRNKLDCWIV